MYRSQLYIIINGASVHTFKKQVCLIEEVGLYKDVINLIYNTIVVVINEMYCYETTTCIHTRIANFNK